MLTPNAQERDEAVGVRSGLEGRIAQQNDDLSRLKVTLDAASARAADLDGKLRAATKDRDELSTRHTEEKTQRVRLEEQLTKYLLAPLKAPFAPADATKARQQWAIHLKRNVEETIDLPGGLKLEVMLIPPGTFLMGSPQDEAGRGLEEVAHEVTITKPFYLGKYEVTQAQYQAVTGADSSKFKGDRLPVETVSHEDAAAFCGKVRFAGGRVGLPTEAQWEYACRAGTTTPFHFGAVLDGRQANCNGSVPSGTTTKGPEAKQTCEVGTFPANAFGLHDMHGNVWEWCQDYYGPYSAVTYPEQGQLQKQYDKSCILRGGSWDYGAVSCRAANRNGLAPDYRREYYGFRVAVRLD